VSWVTDPVVEEAEGHAVKGWGKDGVWGGVRVTVVRVEGDELEAALLVVCANPLSVVRIVLDHGPTVRAIWCVI